MPYGLHRAYGSSGYGQLLNVVPTNDEAMWSIWDKASVHERRLIEELARSVVKIGIG
jgi:hypothetical protein